MKTGDIVYWAPIPGKSGNEWRVVQDWTDSEPKRLLLAEVDGTEFRCYVALACDCTFVREGIPPKRIKLMDKYENAPDENRLPRGCVLATDK